MNRIIYALLILQLNPALAYNDRVQSAIVNARSREGASAVAYVAGRAQDTAKSIKRPSQLSQAKISDQEFYSAFISYGAYRYLRPEILGSWEFADRIENMEAFGEGVEDVRIAAGRARMGTKIKYIPPPLPETIEWLEALAEGREVKVNKIDIHLDEIVRALYKAGLLWVTVKHERGGFQYSQEADGNIWVEERFVSEGNLHPGETRGPYRSLNNLHQWLILSDFETRVSARSRIINRPGEIQTLGIPYDQVTAIRVNSELSARTVRSRLLEALEANGISMRKLQKAVPRVKGVRPACEADVK